MSSGAEPKADINNYCGYWCFVMLTIQKSVSLAKLKYWSIVDKTLKIKQINTIMNLNHQRGGMRKDYIKALLKNTQDY